VRIERLTLESYGHFQALELDFPLQNGRDFCIISGPNEAGKTTLLKAARDLLFGVHPQTPYGWLYGYEGLAVRARLLFADGACADVRRRKGKKDLLAGRVVGEDTVIDDQWLVARLGSVSRELYERVFGFSMAEMEMGARVLEQTEMRDAIASSSLGGGVDIGSVLQSLAGQAETLLSAQGRGRRAINVTVGEIADLRKVQRSAVLRADQYGQRERELTDAEAVSEELAGRLAQLREQQSVLTRVTEALPRRRKLTELERRRDEVDVPIAFLAIEPGRVDQALDGAAAASRRVDELAQQARDEQDKMNATRVDETILEARARIDVLHGEVKHFVEAERDLPIRRSELDRLLRDGAAELASLRPGWALDDLTRRCPDAETSECLSRLVQEHRGLLGRQEQAEADVRRLRKDVGKLTEEIARDGQREDVSLLRRVVEARAQYEHLAGAATKREADLRKLEAEVTAARRRLDPPYATDAPAERLPVPRAEQVREFQRRLAELAVASHSGSEQLDTARAKRQAAERELVAASGASVPTLDRLAELRQARDGLWRTIRARWTAGDTADAPSLSDAFESATAVADEHADRLRDQADAVARREGLARECDALRQAEDEVAERVSGVEAAIAQAEQEWVGLWQPCGFAPASPDVMLAWLADHEDCARRREARDAAQDDCEHLRGEIASLERLARSAFPGDSRPVAELLAEAGSTAAADDKRQALQEGRREQLQSKERDLEDALTVAEQVSVARAAWRTQWRELAEPVGFAPEGDIEVAERIVTQLVGLRGRMREEGSLRQRIRDMTATTDAFRRNVAELCAACAPDLAEVGPREAVETLHTRLAEALEARALDRALKATHEETGRHLERACVEQIRLAGEVAHLRELAIVDDDDGLRLMEVRAECARDLDAEIERLEAALGQVRDRGATERFDEALADALARDAADDELEREVQELGRDIDLLDGELQDARKHAWAAHRELAEVGEESQVARIDGEIESARARLRDHAERYIVLSLARAVLDDEVNRFRREDQPEVILGASRLFRALTEGRYSQVAPSLDEPGAIRVVRDGNEVDLPALSTGTLQQLFLALRLAYIDHYSKGAEPLPVIMDDVLVNFDDFRAAACLRALDEFSARHQVLFFTCHDHLVQLARRELGDTPVVTISGPVG